ncbi:MAG TPA: hypothetical protein VHM30_19475 [Gemmatimonadaceae bacterium]|nr:hypothetical protein [Gemmatimonadaceae bacterium]
MTGPEARAIRERLGLRVEDLAADFDIPPETVEAWEAERTGVPRNVVRLLRWRDAIAARTATLEAAYVASGVAKCAWADSWWEKPAHRPGRRGFSQAVAELNRHFESCPTCQACAAFEKSLDLPPLPDPPAPGGVVGSLFRAQRWIETKPEPLRPALTVGGALGAFMLLRVLLVDVTSGRGRLTTDFGVVLGAAVYGLLVGGTWGTLLPLRRRNAIGTAVAFVLTVTVAVAPWFALTANLPSDADPTAAQMVASWAFRIFVAALALAAVLGWWARRPAAPPVADGTESV